MPIQNINESGTFRDELLKKNLVITNVGNNEWKDYHKFLTGGDNIGNIVSFYPNDDHVKDASFTYKDGKYYDVSSIGNFILNSKTEGSISNNKYYFLNQDTKKEYLDDKGGLNVGGASTEPYNLVTSFLNGKGGVGFGSNGLVTNNDIRSSLTGRILAGTGLIKDSQLGIIGGQQLAIQLGNNALFHLQKETIGKINTDVWTLFDNKKDKFIKPNYDITVPSGAIGKTVDFLADLGGFSLPRSQMTIDLYSFDDKFEYLKIGNIERANQMLETTGNGQVLALMDNLNANILSAKNSKISLSFRQGYAAPFKKGRKDVEEPNMYAYSDTESTILIEKTLLDDGVSPLYDWKSTERSGFDMDFHNDGKFVNKENTVTDFVWYGETYNNNIDDADKDLQDKVIGLSPEDNPETRFIKIAHRKSLLYKTKELFKNNKIATLVSGHGVVGAKNEQIQNIPTLDGKSVGYMSKGSGVLSERYINEPGKITKPEEIFCRTWTPNKQYNEVVDQIKNDALYNFKKGDSSKIGYIRDSKLTSESVLDDTGHVKIPLYDFEGTSSDKVKRYMFSIENLAWLDNPLFIMGCEKGPNGGRIMWFPPYDISFSESVSVNWDKNQFIGRGESLYTYNNTERTGSLSFKIIMDYPSDYDCLKNSDEIRDEIFASIAAGCHDEDGILKYLTKCEIQEIKATEPQTPSTEIAASNYRTPSIEGSKGRAYLFFPNDVHTNYINDERFYYYESGLYDYVYKKIIDPFDKQYIETKTKEDNTTYLDWKDEYKIKYTYNNQSSTVQDKDGNIVNFIKNNGKPNDFGLSYDKDNNIFNDKNSGIPRQRTVYKSYYDGANYGLNGWRADGVEHNIVLPDGDDANDFKCGMPNCKYPGWTHPQFLKDLADYLAINYTVKIRIEGNASISGDDARNGDLTILRGDAIKALLLKKLKQYNSKITNLEKRIFVDKIPKKGNENYNQYNYLGDKSDCDTIDKHQWYLGCKINRRSQIQLIDDPDLLKPEDKPKAPPIPTPPTPQTKQLDDKIRRRTYTECDHFKKLMKEDKFTFDKLKDKLKYFSPAFHSITPEGFNSRLTFLQQCTRQGNTNNTDRPDNLAFGRPPVCILRIGDFFYTKIIIENMSIDYEPLVWDMNPEGVGVQPMIANVTLNFAFIGGSSLTGPIKKLQNALSFNYYANTGIFDGRADRDSAESEAPKPNYTDKPIQIEPIAVDNYILDEDAAKNIKEDIAAIESLKLTAEYDIDINKTIFNKKTNDGFNFDINISELNYDYTVKIYLVGKDVNGKEVKEDLGITPVEFPSGKDSLSFKSVKVEPKDGYKNITLKDKKDEDHKWGSVLDNFNITEISDHMRYIPGISTDEGDEKPTITKDGGMISYDVYSKTPERDKAHIICDDKKGYTFYERLSTLLIDNTISEIPKIINGKKTEFEFEIEFTKNGKIFKSVRRNYYWDSSYKSIKSDVCKAKNRIKIAQGNSETNNWYFSVIIIQQVIKLPEYAGTTLEDATWALPFLNDENEFNDIAYYELTQSNFDSFLDDIKDGYFEIKIDKTKEIKPNLETGSQINDGIGKYIIGFKKIKDDGFYDYKNKSSYINLYNNFKTEIDGYNNETLISFDGNFNSYYKEYDNIDEKERIVYAGFNNGNEKTQLMITEGTITPYIKEEEKK